MLANIIFDLQNLECTYRYNQHRNLQVCDIQHKTKCNIYLLREKLHLHGRFGC